MSRSPLRGAALADAPMALVLRPRAVPPPPPGSVDDLLAEAQRDAERVLSAAHAEAGAMLAAARQEGYAAGHADAREEVSSALATLAELGRSLDEHRSRLEEEAIREATVLSVEIAARILRAEVAARPERVADVLRGAIRRAADRSSLVAHVSPGDLAACRAAAPAILQDMGGIGRLDVVDDPRIGPGSCVLQTSAGDVDATFESQLTRVLDALLAPPDESLAAPAGP